MNKEYERDSLIVVVGDEEDGMVEFYLRRYNSSQCHMDIYMMGIEAEDMDAMAKWWLDHRSKDDR